MYLYILFPQVPIVFLTRSHRIWNPDGRPSRLMFRLEVTWSAAVKETGVPNPCPGSRSKKYSPFTKVCAKTMDGLRQNRSRKTRRLFMAVEFEGSRGPIVW